MAASVQNPGCLPDKEYTGQWYFPTVKAEAGSGNGTAALMRHL